MNVKELYLRTMKFIWLKLGLGLAMVILSTLWLAICMGTGSLLGGGYASFIAFWVWLGGTKVLNAIINQYFGYLVKAGHIAIITEAITTGQIPENQFEVATNMVKSRFATSNVYFVIDKLIAGSVKQLQDGLDTVDKFLGNLPGVGMLISFAKIFVGISLGYVDECCLGYTFYNKEDSVFKSAADGVVIYFQNWKTILKNAITTTFMVIALTLAFSLIPYVILAAIFSAIHLPKILAFILALLIALSIKTAFVDSYVLIRTMVSYMQVAPTTEITFNLYEKLCKLSAKFKELFEKSKISMSSPLKHHESSPQPILNSTKGDGNFCSKCGTYNVNTSAFCSNCGNRINVSSRENYA
ncbi:MAG: zinc ribbon domain-containing protein [Anaerocolumna sp.]